MQLQGTVEDWGVHLDVGQHAYVLGSGEEGERCVVALEAEHTPRATTKVGQKHAGQTASEHCGLSYMKVMMEPMNM
jgi:hypothetical protein